MLIVVVVVVVTVVAVAIATVIVTIAVTVVVTVIATVVVTVVVTVTVRTASHPALPADPHQNTPADLASSAPGAVGRSPWRTRRLGRGAAGRGTGSRRTSWRGVRRPCRDDSHSASAGSGGVMEAQSRWSGSAREVCNISNRTQTRMTGSQADKQAAGS